ncbi:hypothetical protein [Bacillus pseudomycoides]|nr:hypothetical protein [Bacillus pseudomycoides]
MRERFELPNAVVTGMYEIRRIEKGTENWKTFGMNGFLGFGYC